jgi:hypothetical protein
MMNNAPILNPVDSIVAIKPNPTVPTDGTTAPPPVGVLSGATLPTSGGDGPPTFKDEKEKTAYWMGLRKKYGDALAGRMQWLDWSNQKLPTGGTPLELSRQATQGKKIDPALLLTSAMEEGVGLRFPSKDGNMYDHSQAFDNANKNKELNGYDVDGFAPYGLDTIGERANDLIKGGYLPKDFTSKMKPYKAYNEQGTQVTTAAFKDDASAFQAKAAIMAQEQDNLNDYLQKNKINLSPDAQKFFTLAAYNGGLGSALGMLKEYQSQNLLQNDAFLKQKPQQSKYGQVYSNVMPRLVGAKMFNGEGYFKSKK